MDIKKVQRDRPEKKSIPINLRITPTISKWLRDNKVSPQLLFDEAVKELQKK